MNRPGVRVALVLVLLWAFGAAPAESQLLSKRYQFKPGVILETGVSAERGVRLDSVRFELPSTVDGRITRSRGLVTAYVTVSNVSSEPAKVGLAIALFDDQERLLAVGSGGSGLRPIKAATRKTFTLVFEGVYAEAHRASTFQISVEPKL